jgi:hypothetical protein
MWEWNHWRKMISLNDVAVALNVESSKAGGMDGAGVYDAFLNGRHDDIADYCMRDVECVREIYYRMTFCDAPEIERYVGRSFNSWPEVVAVTGSDLVSVKDFV